MPDELLPCPFCGCTPYYTVTVNGTYLIKVGCSTCGIVMQTCNLGDVENPKPSDDIIKAWNSRPHQTVAGDEVENLAKPLKKTIWSHWAAWAMFKEKIHDDIFLEQLAEDAAKAVIEMGYRQQGKFVFDQTEFMKVMMPFHGGNPGPWYSAMEKVYEEYFSKFIQPSVPSFENIQLKAQEVLVDFWYRDRKDKKPSVDIINCSHAIATAIHKLLTEQKG